MDPTMTVTASELIEKAAAQMKEMEEFRPPEWASIVKTGVHKERPPLQKDWWYHRSAAVLCSVRRLGPIGVSKLRTKYGGKKNRGMKSEHHYRGSGSIIRHVLQQLEKAEFIKQNEEGRKGRKITPKGLKFLASLVKNGSGRDKTTKAGRAAVTSAGRGTAKAAGSDSKSKDDK
ncbi:MAG: 30S ribosomal protein S19e [Nanoarchaeota archaeon]|nr:30S ribosomal protein S19e [Nanoarchaeota archaeon]